MKTHQHIVEKIYNFAWQDSYINALVALIYDLYIQSWIAVANEFIEIFKMKGTIADKSQKQ